MIKSTELRIGNWVQDEHNDIQYVYRIWQGGCELSEDESGRDDLDYTEEELFGVPLTPELLTKKCGFVGKYKSCGYAFNNSGFELTSQDTDDDGNDIDGYIFHVYYNHTGAPIYYLHQLQNLYHAIKGEELTIQPL